MFDGLLTYRVLTIAAVAIYAAFTVGSQRQRAEIRYTQFWLAAAPVRQYSRTLAILVVTLIPLAAQLLAVCVLFAAMGVVGNVEATVVGETMLWVAAATAIGAVVGWWSARRSRADAMEGSRYVGAVKPRNETSPSAAALSGWPLAQVRAWGRPENLRILVLIPALFAVQAGSSALHGLSVIAIWVLGGYLGGLVTAVSQTARLAADWLRSTPIPFAQFAWALTRRALLYQVVGTAVAAALMISLGAPLQSALYISVLWLTVVLLSCSIVVADSLSLASAARQDGVVVRDAGGRRSARARLVDSDRGAARRMALARRSEDMTSIVLDIRDVHARYGKHEVLRGVSLQIRTGQWFCLLGPNGVGKSTLLHCVAGRLVPSAGDILVCGNSVRTQTVDAKRKLGFGCAPEQLPGLLTGRQCLEVYANAKGLERIDPEVVELGTALKFSGYLDQFVDTYSLGTRQKLCVLLALLGEPALIVLDEAFNGLDPGSALIVKRHLQQRLAANRCGVLLATHSLDIVEHYADKAALLLDGRIVREWSDSEIAAVREQGADRFEELLARWQTGEARS